MTVSCPDCRSVFRVDPAKVPATGVRARCSVCGGVIAIAAGTLPVSVTPVASSTAVPAFAGGSSRATPVASMATRRPTPMASATVSAAAAPATASMMTPPALGTVARPTPSFGSGVTGTPARSRPAQGTPSAGVSTSDVFGRRPTPMQAPSVNTPVGSTAVSAFPARQGTPSASFTAQATPAYGTAHTGTPAGGSTATGTPAAGKRTINPFLRADPSQRARRLARALVSDLVAYHPQKRDEGIRDGTLRQLFREEIKKSYEEYVEQVGRDVAEASPFFQEALNEILAGGRRIF